MQTIWIIVFGLTVAYTILEVVAAGDLNVAAKNKNVTETRIVNGYDTYVVFHKYIVQLRYTGYQICGGTLITFKHVLSAAHCTDFGNVRDFSIKAGTSYINGRGVVRKVVNIWIHPDYSSWTLANDVAVVKLRRPVISLLAIPVPLCSVPLMDGNTVTVAGWGTTSEGGSSPNQLQAVQVDLLGASKCQNAYPGEITTSMFCASRPNKDSCQGDSGGPLIRSGQVCGIVSWGYGCARPGNPGVYTNVKVVKPFIVDKMWR